MQKQLFWRGAFCAGVAATAMMVVPASAGASSSGSSHSGGLFPAHSWATGSHAASAGSVNAASLPTAGLEVVASGLNQPHGLTFGPDGNLLVASVGDGHVGPACVIGTEPACADTSGTIDKVTPSGTVTTLVSGLSSVGNSSGFASGGVADTTVVGGTIYAVVQDQNINPITGAETYGAAGLDLGDLVSAPLGGGPATVIANLAHYEAVNNPDHGAGSGPGDPPIDSDPYGVTSFEGSIAVADAAGNDVLLVNPTTHVITTLAVLPLVPETFMGHPITAQAVPTSLAVGPDGSLYVGELGGAPADVGAANIYKISPAPAHTLTKVAGGFTMIGAIAFDPQGQLLVLEIDTAGLLDPSPFPAPGALLRLNVTSGSRTTLASDGLEFPLGLAVAHDGTIYTTNYGVIPGAGGPLPGASGEIVKIGGYRMAASDGGVFTFGSFGFYGSMGGSHLNAPVVGLASDPAGPGYWLAAADGGVFTFGKAAFLGSEGGTHLNAPVVAIAPMPDGGGYWLVASDGGVFNYGDAPFLGSLGATHLNAPVVGIAPTADGGGYYLFASDGGVFNFGDAKFHGSMGGQHLNKPIVGGASTPTDDGYYLVASDGGIFNFGDAGFFGSLGGTHLNKPIVGMQVSGTGGYDLAASDGGVFTFGAAGFYGSLGSTHLNSPVIGIG